MGSPIIEQERDRRDRVVAGSVNDAEEREVLDAFEQAGFKVKSKAARVILMSFARSARVRDSVAAFARENPVVLAD
jgi:hypothetical protein